MNCRHCQRDLLNTENPADPGLAVSAHLAGCMACRDYQRQLLLIEANVPRVPVPASTAKGRLLARVLGIEANPTSEVAPANGSPSAPPASGGLRPRLATPSPRLATPGARLAALLRSRAVLAAAAAVLVAVGLSLGYWLSRTLIGGDSAASPEQAQNNNTPGPKPPPADPFNKKTDKQPEAGKVSPVVARLMECDLKLAEAETARDRVLALAELADLLQAEARAVSKKSAPADVGKLAALYKDVILKGVVPHARELPMAERREVLDALVQQLEQTVKGAEQLAGTTPAAREALQVIASAARDGDTQLRQLMEGTE